MCKQLLHEWDCFTNYYTALNRLLQCFAYISNMCYTNCYTNCYTCTHLLWHWIWFGIACASNAQCVANQSVIPQWTSSSKISVENKQAVLRCTNGNYDFNDVSFSRSYWTPSLSLSFSYVSLSLSVAHLTLLLSRLRLCVSICLLCMFGHFYACFDMFMSHWRQFTMP